MAFGGWLGLFGGHGRRGARRNRGVALQNFTKALRAAGRLGSPPVRGHRHNFTKALRAAGVHDGIGVLPDGIGLSPHTTVPARTGHGGGTV